MIAAEKCFKCFWLVQPSSWRDQPWKPEFYCHHPDRRTLDNWTRRDCIMPLDPVPAWCPGSCDHWPDQEDWHGNSKNR